jgi:hypothetical protein
MSLASYAVEDFSVFRMIRSEFRVSKQIGPLQSFVRTILESNVHSPQHDGFHLYRCCRHQRYFVVVVFDMNARFLSVPAHLLPSLSAACLQSHPP